MSERFKVGDHVTWNSEAVSTEAEYWIWLWPT